MSGFEPVIAEAVVAEAGTTALATEVMASSVAASNALAAANLAAYTPAATGALASIPAGLGSLLGGAAPVLESAASGGLPTLVEQLTTTNPEVLTQLQTALKPAILDAPAISPEITNLQQFLAKSPMPEVTNLGEVAGGNQEVMRDIIQRSTENIATPVTDITTNPATENILSSADRAQLLSNSGYAGEAGNLTKSALYGDAGYGNIEGMVAPEKSAFSKLIDSSKYLTKAKDFLEKQDKEDLALYGGVASLAAPLFKKKKESPGAPAAYDGPLSRLSYDPDRYTPQQLAQPTPYRARYAQGGVSQAYKIPSHMSTIDDYISQASNGDMATVVAKAKNGDQNAMIALNKLQKTPNQNYASGGISNLGGYSDGGRMLKGPGDGMSDNIPASIAGRQPARLANEEFVIPADVVSHLGNGSSEAGAKQLYKMMDRVRQARTGNKKQGKQIKPAKYMPV
jgi:hypothetical protein